MSQDKEPERTLNLDRILVEEIGQFGRYQARVLVLALLVVILVSWANTEYLFSVARIPTRCYIPECESEPPQWSPAWLESAVPAGEQCQRYGSSSAPADPLLCSPDLFNTSVLQPCEDFVYENTNTVVYDFSLACDEWWRTFVGSARTMGTLVNLPVSGYVADRWGRRPVILLSTLNCAWVGLARYWANSYAVFLFLQVFESVIGSGAYSSFYILLAEVTGPKYRLVVGASLNSVYAIGQILLGLIAWALPQWRNLTLAIYIPHFIIIAYFWLVNDSVRWLLSKGKYEEAEVLLKKIAATNRKKLSPNSEEALRQAAEVDIKRKTAEADLKEPWLITEVFRHKRILLRCVVAPVWWISSTFVYYGMTIHSVNMAGNTYVNFILVTAAEVPGYWAAAYLLTKLGRKPVLIAAFWGCAACQLAFILIPSDLQAASLAVYLVGKFCIATEVTTLYMYTAELFPTRHRNQLFAYCSMLGRVGAIVAPLTPAIGASTFEEFPSVLFGSFALLSGLLVFLAPETHGRPLSDTMEESEKLGKQDKLSTRL